MCIRDRERVARRCSQSTTSAAQAAAPSPAARQFQCASQTGMSSRKQTRDHYFVGESVCGSILPCHLCKYSFQVMRHSCCFRNPSLSDCCQELMFNCKLLSM
eukprot:1048535-Amphidinium_carterae.2